MPSFGGGLSFCAHVVRWGARTTAVNASTVELPPNERPALQILRDCLARKTRPIATDATTPFGEA
jgi:3-oxoacyl-[acyl-carrier-protein] synthase-3